MIKIKTAMGLTNENTLFINVKEIYFCGIRIYKKIVNSELPIDIVNCYPENQQPKMGFKK